MGYKFVVAVLWKWGVWQADYKVCIGKSRAIRYRIKVRVGDRHIIVTLSVVDKTCFSFGFIIYVGCLTYCEGRNPNQCITEFHHMIYCCFLVIIPLYLQTWKFNYFRGS